jgi:hypothetical protein
MSEDFVRYLDSPVFEIGYFRLRGFSRMQLLFGLPAAAPKNLNLLCPPSARRRR